MLLLIGGLEGSGKRYLAREIARLRGYYLYPLRERKQRSFQVSGGIYRERVTPARSDEDRIRTYSRVAQDLPMLAKLYSGVVMYDVFHRAVPRDYLLDEAKKHFGEVAFVWAESSDDSTVARMVQLGQKDHAVRMIERKKIQERELQAKEDAIFVMCGESIDAAVAALDAALPRLK